MDPKKLANAVAKEARLLATDDHPQINIEIQQVVGDPDDTAISTFTQFRPNPGTQQMANPLSPIQGDEIFFNFMQPGSVFQSHDGHWWLIEDYDWDGRVAIRDVWYPQVAANVTVNDVRRSIHSWVEPIQQMVPPPPPGVDYGAQPVKIVGDNRK